MTRRTPRAARVVMLSAELKAGLLIGVSAGLMALLIAGSVGRPVAVLAAGPMSVFGDRYQRTVTVAPGSGQACAVLDAAVLAHAAASLDDLRLLQGSAAGGRAVAVATTVSEPVGVGTDEARVLNRHVTGGNSGVERYRKGDRRPIGEAHLSFDLQMPARPYTAVMLTIGRENYIAEAEVSGEEAPGGRLVALGRFQLFDLTRAGLFHDTVIPLEESTFPYLHVDLMFERMDAGELAGTPLPGATGGQRTLAGNGSSSSDVPGAGAASYEAALRAMALSARVPPSREAQSLYTETQQTRALVRRGGQTLARFHLPLHVPVERVVVALAAGETKEFSRRVEITAWADPLPATDAAESGETLPEGVGSEASVAVEHFAGTIFRVRRKTAHGELEAEELSIPVAIGSNMQRPATLEVAIDDDATAIGMATATATTGADDRGAGRGGRSSSGGADARRSLPIASVALAMRQRAICFDPPEPGGEALTLAYGEVRSAGSERRTMQDGVGFQLAGRAREAKLGPEVAVAAFSATPSAASLNTLSAASSNSSPGGGAAAGRDDRRRERGRRRIAVAIGIAAMLLAVTLLAGRTLLRERR